jgi:hypothetical protein
MEKERIAQQNRRIRVDHIKFGGGSVCACDGREGCVICGWQNLHSQHAVALAAVTVVLIDIRKVFTWFFFYLYPHLLLSILYLSNLFSPSFQFPNNKFFSMMRTPRMNQKTCGYFGTLKYKFFFSWFVHNFYQFIFDFAVLLLFAYYKRYVLYWLFVLYIVILLGIVTYA